MPTQAPHCNTCHLEVLLLQRRPCRHASGSLRALMHRRQVERASGRTGICHISLVALPPKCSHCTPTSCSRHSFSNADPRAFRLGRSRLGTGPPRSVRGRSPSNAAARDFVRRRCRLNRHPPNQPKLKPHWTCLECLSARCGGRGVFLCRRRPPLAFQQRAAPTAPTARPAKK